MLSKYLSHISTSKQLNAFFRYFRFFRFQQKKALDIFIAMSILYAAYRHMLLKWITPIALNKMAALSSQCIMIVIVHLCAEFGVCDVLRIPWFFEWDDLQPWPVYHARQETKSLPQQPVRQTYWAGLTSAVFVQRLVLISHHSGMPCIPQPSERDDL